MDLQHLDPLVQLRIPMLQQVQLLVQQLHSLLHICFTLLGDSLDTVLILALIKASILRAIIRKVSRLDL